MLWLAVVMFVALAVAVLRGGRLTNLADIRIKLWWLLPMSFALQLGTGLLPNEAWAETAGVAMVLVSYVPLIGVVFANRDRKGMWLSGIGVLLNFTVILLNGGMPVLGEAALVASGSPSFRAEPPSISAARSCGSSPTGSVRGSFTASLTSSRGASGAASGREIRSSIRWKACRCSARPFDSVGRGRLSTERPSRLASCGMRGKAWGTRDPPVMCDEPRPRGFHPGFAQWD